MLNLSPGWWLKRPKEEGAEIPAMERLIGPLHTRGRPSIYPEKNW